MEQDKRSAFTVSFIIKLVVTIAAFVIIYPFAWAGLEFLFPGLKTLGQATVSNPPVVQPYTPVQQPTLLPVLPPGGDTDYKDGHWYELCKNDPTCTIGRYNGGQGLFLRRDGIAVDPKTVSAYHMVFENAMVVGAEYSLCEMDESVVWIKEPGDQYATELVGCLHVRFDKIEGNYYWFINLDSGKTLIAPYVSYNVFPWVTPIVGN